jgi:microcystin-dependent protein
MKPLNLDNSPCSPISSNCVIWQGPNIPCINLCTGDTVSDVVYKLALELCEILDQLNITNYDLACLNLPCPPADFQALIQILINKICELEGIPAPAPQPDGGNCPTNCIVAVADCLGGGTDNLLNYVQTIATRVCDLVGEIHIIQNSIATINTTLNFLQQEINDIPVYTLPDIAVPTGCTIGVYTGPTNVALDTLFEAFLEDWCTYISTVGTAADFAPVLSPACTLSGSTYFGADIVSEPGWINPPTNLADAISNIWTSICFFYNYNYAQTIVTGSGGITVTPSYDPLTNTTTYDVSSPAFLPAGVVVPWASPNLVPPIGWFLCDGSTKLTVNYPDLFAAIGTTYGSVGPGSFNLPQMANRIPVGLGTNADGYNLSAVANTGGNRVEALTDAQLPPHTHDLSGGTISGTTSSAGSHRHGIWADPDGGDGSGAIKLNNDVGSDYDTTPQAGAGGNGAYISDAGVHTHSLSGTVAGDTGDGTPALQGLPHGNMQPYIVMQYIIKY